GRPGPKLILPNHPGYIDPILLLATLWPALHPRPMVFVSDRPSLTFSLLLKLLNAIAVPDLARASARARARAEKALADTVAALQQGDNVLLYPAGRVYRTGK